VAEALQQVNVSVSSGSPLAVIGLPYLIALKLYAGGRWSTNDVIELLERNCSASTTCSPQRQLFLPVRLKY
jgi:hypothetical protein